MAGDRPDFSPTAVDVVLRPEWAAKEATDKDFYTSATDVASGGGTFTAYTVPAGKTLYITQLAFSSVANLAADKDKNQVCLAAISDFNYANIYWVQGGNGGGRAVFSKSLVFVAGEVVWFSIFNEANHNCDLTIYAGGYEI